MVLYDSDWKLSAILVTLLQKNALEHRAKRGRDIRLRVIDSKTDLTCWIYRQGALYSGHLRITQKSSGFNGTMLYLARPLGRRCY